MDTARGVRATAFLCLAWIPAVAAAPKTFTIDGTSTATAHVGKTGLGSFAGHEHLVLAQDLQGEVVLDSEDLSKSSVDLIIKTRSLTVSEKGEPEGDAAKVQEAMRGPSVLDAARFATIHFGSQAVSGKQTAPGSYELLVTGEFSLHGVVKTFKVPVQVTVQGTALTASGKLTVKQTDFGIEPTTAAGGLVKVEDEVAISFRIGGKS